MEDLSYPHKRFAKVGGLSEYELSRLEVSKCHLLPPKPAALVGNVSDFSF